MVGKNNKTEFVEIDVVLQVVEMDRQVRVLQTPSMDSEMVGVLEPNTSGLHATKMKDNWYYIEDRGGWVSGQYVMVTENNTGNIITPDKEVVTPSVDPEKKSYTFDEQVEKYLSAQEEVNSEVLTTKNLDGILGIPYQFMESVDQRIPGTYFGRTYANRIVSRMPLLLLTPGKVNFMKDYKSKNDAALALMDLIESAVPTDLNDLTAKVGRYYTFDFNYVDYYQYVNSLMHVGCRFLGIHNVVTTIGGKEQRFKDIDWSTVGQDSFKQILSTKEYIAFYVDSASSASETLTNDTTQSQLASKVNSMSDLAKEIQFLTGATTGKEFLNAESEASVLSSIDDISNKYLNGSQIFKDVASNFATVACGGKLIFPEIWSDSDFSKDYDVNIKLRSPDKDPVTWYMTIYRPLAYLISMAAPMQADNPNGYISPFLVRGYYKGLFNCDMGIISNMSINKGKESGWTLNGLPTEVDVSLTIKDLYNMLSITKEKDAGEFVNNICLMSYIANTCGVNINEPDFQRMVDIYIMLKADKWKNMKNTIWNTVTQDFTNKYEGLASTIFKILR